MVIHMTLKEAVLRQDLEQVKEILRWTPGAVNEPDEEGMPIPFLAAETGNLEIVKYLVEYSYASMNTVDALNRNILHYGAASGNVELCRYLVERVGMKITGGDRNLLTPFEIAHTRGHRELEAFFAGKVGAAYEDMYHNPIRRGMYPDPSIVRVGEDYYMVNSSFIFFPCIPISHSRDLLHWEIIGHAITNPDWAGLDGLEGGRGYWAPDISYDNGTFYITATLRLNDGGPVYRRQMVVTASRPEGPYGKPVFLEEDGIDPSIFHEDGRHYMLLNRGARIFEISADGSKQLSEAKLLYYGDQKRAPEGPHLLKKDGFYYLFMAEGGTGTGHRITVMRSRELMGLYEPCPYNPIMRQEDPQAGIQRAGHGKPVLAADGQWYMVYLCGRCLEGKWGMLGRETALDPVTWTADGWPIVNGLQGPSVLQKKPGLGEAAAPQKKPGPGEAAAPQKKPELQEAAGEDEKLRNGGIWRDDFRGPKLSGEWMTPREPEQDGICFSGGRLFLKGSRFPLSRVEARNILLRRQTAFDFDAWTEIESLKLGPGQEIGLTCYYDENTWVCFGAVGAEGAAELMVKEHIGDEDRVFWAGEISLKQPLRLGVETRGLTRRFLYRTEAGELRPVCTLENVYYLCSEGLKKGKRFTGAMVGLYVYAGDQDCLGVFRYFEYREEKQAYEKYKRL